MMHFRPDLVDISLLPMGGLDFPRDGCSVNAKEATRGHGEFLARLFVEQAAPKIQSMLEEALALWPEEIATGD